jgi:catalase (peroxidase I)
MGKTQDRETHRDSSRSNVSLHDLMDVVGYTSIEELSKASGVSARTIFNCRYGRNDPNNGTVFLLAMALKTDTQKIRSALGCP